MKAIIIEDKDSLDLLRQLELAKFRKSGMFQADDQLYQDVHRHFHYVVTKWLQTQGAETVGR